MLGKNMLGEGLAEVAGPLKDFAEKLGGEGGAEWLLAFKRFLRKEEPWPKFVYDRTRDGWELLEDVDFAPIDPGKLELVPFLNQGETIIGTEMARRAKELRANLGQRHAEFLLEHQAKIPKEFRKYYLVFTGTKWSLS